MDITFIPPVLASIVVNIFTSLLKILQYLYFFNVPKISGNWKTENEEPSIADIKKKIPTQEKVKLCRIGKVVYGESSNIDENKLDREFVFKGLLDGNTFKGEFKPKKSKSLSGKGVFQLIIKCGYDSMEGYCLWHDKDTGKIEASTYVWTKI